MCIFLMDSKFSKFYMNMIVMLKMNLKHNIIQYLIEYKWVAKVLLNAIYAFTLMCIKIQL